MISCMAFSPMTTCMPSRDRRIADASCTNFSISILSDSEALEILAADVRRVLSDAGIPFDRKNFNPHITLLRKPHIPEQAHFTEIEVPPAVMTVRDVCLYRSDRTERGMAYTVIGRSKASPRQAKQ